MSKHLLRGAMVVLLFGALTAAAAPTYRLTKLDNLAGTSGSNPRSINNLGEVAGITTSFPSVVVRWDADGTIHDLGVSAGGLANDINDLGQVAGYTGSREVFRWTPGLGLETFGPGIGVAINRHGTVAGHGDIPGPLEQIAQLWTSPGSGSTILGALAGHNRSAALDVNSTGQVVGTSFTSISNFDTPTMSRAFLWTEVGGMQDLGALPGHEFSRAEAINDAGVVVGYSWESLENFTPVAFRWTSAEGMNWLAPGAQTATDINSSGQIVGGGEMGRYLWTSADGALPLADLLDASGSRWNMFSPAINDLGQIVLIGNRDNEFNQHAVLLTPVPEPSVTAILASVMIGLTTSRLRQPRRDS